MKRIFLVMLVFVSIVYFELAHTLPSRVILIRAGEAPQHGNGLSQRGKERARALVPYFLNQDYLQTFGHPVAIFAHRETQSEPSLRPVETVIPLSEALGVKINKTFTKNDFRELVKIIKTNPEYEAKTVLVVWNNDNMNKIVSELGLKTKVLPWPEEVHDRVWIVDFLQNKTISFKNYPQRLLYGDSEQ